MPRVLSSVVCTLAVLLAAFLVPAAAASGAVQWSLPAMAISPAGHDADDQYVATDPQGDAIAIWRESDGSNARIYVSVRPPGGDFGLAEPISPAGQDAGFQPRVALDANGNAIAVWTQYTGASTSVVQAAFRPADGTFGAPDTISPTSGLVATPRIAFDLFGDAVAVWTHNDGGTAKDQIQANIRSAGSTWHTGSLPVSTDGVEARGPAVALDSSTTTAVVVWRQSDGGTATVYAATKQLFVGSTFSVPVAISAAGNDEASAMLPQIANSGSETVAAWSRATGPSTAVAEVGVRPPDHAFGAPQTLSDDTADAGNVAVAADAKGDAVVAWDQLSPSSPIIGVASQTGNGSFVRSADLSSLGGTPDLAMDPQGHAVAVWIGFDGTNTRIEAADADPGKDFGPPTLISEAGMDAETPQVAIDPIGNPVAVWRRSDGSNQRVEAVSGGYVPPAPPSPPPPGPTGIELSQGVSRWDFVPFVAGKTTLLRVYIGNASVLPQFLFADVRATRGGQPLDPSPLAVSGAGRTANPSSLEDMKSTINAVLPTAWTHGTIDLDVTLRASAPCNGCFPDGDHFILRGVRFRETGRIVIRPVKIAWDGERPGLFSGETTFEPPDGARLPLWDDVARLFPIARDHIVVDNWRGTMYAGDTSQIWRVLLDLSVWAALADAGVGGHYVGYLPSESRDTNHYSNAMSYAGMATMPTGTSNVFVVGSGAEAQELAHNFGLGHAGHDHGETYPTEPWPYPHGGIGTYGYNIVPGDGGPPRYVDPGTPTGTHTHDFMSYGGPPIWTSPRTWIRLFNVFLHEPGGEGGPNAQLSAHTGTARAAARARLRYANSILVAGGLGLTRGGTIEQVLRTRADLSPQSPAGKALATVAVQDRRGRTLESYPLVYPVSDPPPGEPIPFVVALPARPGAAAVVVKRAGKVVARVRRSRHRPRVRLLAPTRRTVLRRSRPIKLRWIVRRRSRKVRFNVFYRAGHAPFRPLAVDLTRTNLKLAPGTLPAGRIRFRVAATVGLDSASSSSPTLRVRK
jgi:hypothetical protein